MRTKYKFVILVIIACLCSILIYYFCDKAKPVTITPSILKIQSELEKSFLISNDYTYENPKVILNPYNISPLTALIVFETKDLTAPTITVVGKDKNTTFSNTFKPSKIHYLPVYGLYPNAENEVILKVNGHEKRIIIKTEKLPEDFVTPTSVVSDKSILGNELYFVTPATKGYTAAYDVNGDVRWYLTEQFIWDIQRLDNGHLLLGSNRIINEPYYTTGLTEIDLLGKIYYEYNLEGGYHHDVYEMEDGDLLVLTNKFENETVEDYVVEIDRETGKIIKEIDLNKIIPNNEGLNKDYATSYDWFHNNSIWFDNKTNSITLSGRHNDSVINIDYDTLELNWIVGDSSLWSKKMKKYFLTPINKDFIWQYAQHAAMILPDGNLFLFDNGNNKSKTKTLVEADNNYSRAVIFDIDTTNMTINTVFEYGKNLGKDFYSPYISDVDYLYENHYLISSGGNSSYKGINNNVPASLTKYDKLTSTTVELLNNKEIFKMILPTNTYRAEKLSLYSNDVYTPVNGVQLGSLGKTKTIKNNSLLLFKDSSKEIIKKYDIVLNKESDRLIVTGTFDKDDKVNIILDNVFDKKTYDFVISKNPYTGLCIDLGNNTNDDKLRVNRYINDIDLFGKYYIYIEINNKIYDLDLYTEYTRK